jgi:hypothetical protein
MTLQREELLTELRRLATALGRGPTPDEIDEKSA